VTAWLDGHTSTIGGWSGCGVNDEDVAVGSAVTMAGTDPSGRPAMEFNTFRSGADLGPWDQLAMALSTCFVRGEPSRPKTLPPF
jgi:hypothetical protein